MMQWMARKFIIQFVVKQRMPFIKILLKVIAEGDFAPSAIIIPYFHEIVNSLTIFKPSVRHGRWSCPRA